MEGLIDLIPRLHGELFRARRNEARQLEQALTSHQVIGVHGEPEVGVTSLLNDVVRRMGKQVIRLDLVGAYSDDYLTWVLARELAKVIVPDPTTRSLATLGDGLRPSHATGAIRDLRNRLGTLAELAFAPAPNPDLGVDLGDTLNALTNIAHGHIDLAIWVDHLQEPGLTSRHPVNVDRLLWQIRAIQQQVDLQVILSGNRSASRMAHEAQRAFYGDGEWITIQRPTVRAWHQVAAAVLPQISAAWTAMLIDLTDGHPATTLGALASQVLRPADDPQALWSEFVALQVGLTARSMQHARSLHRLGGELLERIARGEGPYQERLGLPAKDILKVVDRLHHAGLIWQPAPRRWKVTNPVVAVHLRGTSFTPSPAVPFADH